MTPDEKADAAKYVLESPVFREVHKDIRERFVRKLEDDASHESAQLVALNLQQLNLIFTTVLKSYVDDMTMVKHKREQDKFIERTRERVA